MLHNHCDSAILEWNLVNIIFNLVHPKVTHIINFVILATKFYLFQCKCGNKQPNSVELIYEIANYRNTEYYNVMKTNSNIFGDNIIIY